MAERSVDDILDGLDSKVILRGATSLNEAERDVWLSVRARLLIGNGGFRHYFEGGPRDLADVALRLRHLGFDAASAACERVASTLFPGGYPFDPTRVRELLAIVDWKSFRGEEQILFEVSLDDLLRAVGEYVRHNETAFRDLE